ncbi:spore cortex biosynthesis protein YabQ [Gracilibacillus ureilyticus]|uniref:Spore cortex biosynthesis protein YabQ n=1 Tax=Gracilibacillus ureilyticus TaxID=531814 RepID=A0A1H9VMD5_9BACI|nr:spore cortex biosynthesis protein YabQ [Gracilibacillus ureilyticus]SES22752.1 spore cortex biosynthesis protein YabQ [Gracilibacillus ureilyticus]
MTLETQFLTMFTMIAFGVYIGVAYITFKRIALWWADHIIFRYLFELFFWIVQAVLLFFVLYVINEGIVRFYVFIALLCGYAMFKALFEQLYRRLLERILFYLAAIFRFLFRCIRLLLINPLKWIITAVLFTLYRIVMMLLKLLNFLLLIILYPFRHLFLLIFRLVPEKRKKYFYPILNFFSKIKWRKK